MSKQMPLKLPQPVFTLTGRADQETEIYEDFEFMFRLKGSRGYYRMLIRKGYRWNGGSMPPASWSIIRITPHGNPKWEVAFLFHDAVYDSQLLPRITADELLGDIAIAYGADEATAKAVVIAVRTFGSEFYDDCPDREEMRKFIHLEFIKEEK